MSAAPMLDTRLSPGVPRGQERRWFRADGWLLAIDDAGDAARDTTIVGVRPLHDALLLGECDELLGSLACLRGRESDWRPVDPDAVPALDFTLTSKATADAGDADQVAAATRVGLALPGSERDDLLARASRSDVGATLLAHRVFARLVLESVILDDADRARLGPGALLIAPASFASPWRGRLAFDAAADADLPVVVDRDTGSVTRAAEPAAPTPGGSARVCEITLAASLELGIDRWRERSADDEPALACGSLEGAAALVRMDLGPTDPARQLSGTLTRLGEGYGVLLASSERAERQSWT